MDVVVEEASEELPTRTYQEAEEAPGPRLLAPVLRGDEVGNESGTGRVEGDLQDADERHGNHQPDEVPVYHQWHHSRPEDIGDQEGALLAYLSMIFPMGRERSIMETNRVVMM